MRARSVLHSPEIINRSLLLLGLAPCITAARAFASRTLTSPSLAALHSSQRGHSDPVVLCCPAISPTAALAAGMSSSTGPAIRHQLGSRRIPPTVSKNLKNLKDSRLSIEPAVSLDPLQRASALLPGSNNHTYSQERFQIERIETERLPSEPVTWQMHIGSPRALYFLIYLRDRWFRSII